MGQINPFIVAANQSMTESRFREQWTRLEEGRGNKLSQIQYLNFSFIEIIRLFGASIQKIGTKLSKFVWAIAQTICYSKI